MKGVLGSWDGLQGILDNSGALHKAGDEVFQAAREKEIDFPASEYNLQRLRELAVAVSTALAEGAGEKELAEKSVAVAVRDRLKLPEVRKKTQLEAVVEYLGHMAGELNYNQNLQLWLPVLPTELYLADLTGYSENAFNGSDWPKQGSGWELEAIVGLCDDPVNQAQMPLVVDFANGGTHAILGTVVSGKSTFMLTVLYSLINRYTPEDLNIYVLDFSGKMLSALEKAPHVGGVLYENEGEKIRKLLVMLNSVLEQRKTEIRGGGFRQYVQAARAAGKKAMPAIIFVIDNYSSFQGKTEGAYEDFITKLAKEGVNYGIFLFISALNISMQEIPYRMAENIRTMLCLEMSDIYGYNEPLRVSRLEVYPESNVKGRGLAKVGDSYLEYQTAIPLPAENDFERGELIRKRCEALSAAWGDRRAGK